MPAFFPDFIYGSDNVNIKAFGAVADGTSHPLSEFYSSLGAAQNAYNDAFAFVTSLSQEIDWAACQAASNVGFGAAGFEHAANVYLNKNVYGPAGYYVFGDDTWVIRNLAAGRIYGTAENATLFTGNKKVIHFDGFWYGDLEHFSVAATPQTWAASHAYVVGKLVKVPALLRSFIVTVSGTSGESEPAWTTDGSPVTDGTVTWIEIKLEALDIDGREPDEPYVTRGVQAITINKVGVNAGGLSYAFTMSRDGNGPDGPGAQGSECNMIMHLSGATEACYYQVGFNALNNQFLTGTNFADYDTHGALIESGDCSFASKVAFQPGFGSDGNGSPLRQLTRGGYDILIGQAGALSSAMIHGVRTEGFRLLRNDGSVLCDVRGCTQNVGGIANNEGGGNWLASHDYALNEYVVMPKTKFSDGVGRLFKVTTAGTSASSEPTWPTTGTVSDGSLVWTEVPINFIESASGSVDIHTCNADVGAMVFPSREGFVSIGNADSPYTVRPGVGSIFVDTTDGDVTINMPDVSAATYLLGGELSIIKSNNAANTITITGLGTISGGATAARTYRSGTATTGGGPGWFLISSV